MVIRKYANYVDYFVTRARLSWFDYNPVLVKSFSYNLAQYTSSVYASIAVLIEDDKVNDFKNIETLSIKDRRIEVWFEDELRSDKFNQKFFSGPFKFCVVNYEIKDSGFSEVDFEYAGFTSGKIILLHCLDPVFYSMTLNEKVRSFGQATASNVVEKIVSENGGTSKIVVPTDVNYNWLQTQMTDYDMIRSLLPYSRSLDGKVMYNFFMFNEEAYFAPITAGAIAPFRLTLDMIINSQQIVYNTNFKFLIEKYGGKDTLNVFNRGFRDFKKYNPKSFVRQSYIEKAGSRKQHRGVSTKYINVSIDDPVLQEIYATNLRHRVYTFSKIVQVNTDLIPDITPLSCIEVISQDEDGKLKELDGLYYVASVTYNFGMTNNYPTQPFVNLILCTDNEIEGIESVEGGPIG